MVDRGPGRAFIEISADLLDGLTNAERRTLDAAFERRGLDLILHRGVSRPAVLRALPVVEKMRQIARLPLPEPPQPADWRVWQHREGDGRRRSYNVLAAGDSAVLRHLRRSKRSTPESRHQLAMRAVARVERLSQEL